MFVRLPFGSGDVEEGPGIRRLYDGLWDASSWQAGLDHLCASLQGHHLVSLTTAPAGGEETPVFWSVHVDEPHIEAFLRHADEVSALTRAAPMGQALPVEAVAPHRVLVPTKLYQSAIRPMGGHYGAFAITFAEGLVAICRPPTAQPFGDPEIRQLQDWLPHLEIALRLKRHLLAVGRKDAAIEKELEQLDVGILLLDRAGRVLHANKLAETAIRDEKGGPSPQMLRWVQAISPDGHRHAIARGPSRYPLVARVVPLGRLGGERLPDGARAARVVFLRDPEQETRSTAGLLMEGFGLTRREASLAELLGRDLSLAEAAGALGISRENARVHLKRIFSKTGLRRQAQLVSLMLRLQV